MIVHETDDDGGGLFFVQDDHFLVRRWRVNASIMDLVYELINFPHPSVYESQANLVFTSTYLIFCGTSLLQPAAPTLSSPLTVDVVA